MTNTNLFNTTADLMIALHRVESAVTLDNVQWSGSSLEDKPTKYNDKSFARTSKLSKQFSFRAVSVKPAEIQLSLSTLIARVGQHENQFAAMLRLTCHLPSENSKLSMTQMAVHLPAHRCSRCLRPSPPSIYPSHRWQFWEARVQVADVSHPS
jgi:hypothetical protein